MATAEETKPFPYLHQKSTPMDYRGSSLQAPAASKQPEIFGPQKVKVESSGASSSVDLGKLLLEAAKQGDTEQVRELMSRGAPFTTDWLGTTPLHLAAKHNHLETCRVLLRGGLSKEARTKVDRTPLHLAVFEENVDVAELLLQNNSDPNGRDMLKMTPLHWAVEKGNERLVELLLKHGADPGAVSKFRKTPLMMAAEYKRTRILQRMGEQFKGKRPPDNGVKWIKAEKPDSRIDEDGNISTPPPPAAMSIATRDSVDEEEAEQSVDDDTEEAASKVGEVFLQNAVKPGQQLDSSAIKMLKEHGIQMLSDDGGNVIESALQSGRKLVLSEAGKIMLNNAKQLPNILPSKVKSNIIATMPRIAIKQEMDLDIAPDNIRRQKMGKSMMLTPDSIKKQINSTEYKKALQSGSFKMHSIKSGHCLPSLKQHSRTPQQNKRPLNTTPLTAMKPSKIAKVMSQLEGLPNETTITLANDGGASDFVEIGGDGTIPARNHSAPFSTLEKHVMELRRQTEELRRQLEVSRKQNESYRLRLEKLEQEVETLKAATNR